MNTRLVVQGKTIASACAALVFLSARANAQTSTPTPDAQQLLQQQQQTIQLLLDQINQLKQRVTQLEQQAGVINKVEAPAESVNLKPATASAVAADNEAVVQKLSMGQLPIGHTNLSLSGFIEGAVTVREHNEFAGASNTYFGTPFPNQDNYDDRELRADARNSRIRMDAVSNLQDNTLLTGRLEFDWQGIPASATQNNNGFSPRLRHVFMEADALDIGWHLVIGQSYSLTTPYGNLTLADGSAAPDVAWSLRPNQPIINIDPLDDIGPAGVNAPRQMQIRVIKDLSNNAAIAISLENPLVTWGANAAGTSPIYSGTTLLPGSNAQFNNNSAQPLSLSAFPDVIVKFGYDPTPNYHFEGLGIVRSYKDMAGTTGLTGTGRVTGNGAAFSTYIKAWPGKFDLTGGIGYGSLGGYAGDGIPDVSFDSTGKPIPIKESQVWLGAIGHPNVNLDLFAYVGEERAKADAVDGTDYGYGNPNYLNTGCDVIGGACHGNTKLIWDAQVGAIWRFYNGAYGHMDFLPQLTYLKRTLFTDINGFGPSANNLALDLAFRYWPF